MPSSSSSKDNCPIQTRFRRPEQGTADQTEVELQRFHGDPQVVSCPPPEPLPRGFDYDNETKTYSCAEGAGLRQLLESALRGFGVLENRSRHQREIAPKGFYSPGA